VPKLIVYRDKEYPTSWISHEHAEEIANYLKGKGFNECGAKALRDWMKKVITEGTKDTVVVFAQDVAPDTVFDDKGANALIRQYLDFGGRVVWMGDIPFHLMVGAQGDKKESRVESCIDILSIIPVFLYAPRGPVRITPEGNKMGLKSVWSSVRPIVSDKKIMEKVKFLATSEALVAKLSMKYERHGIVNKIKKIPKYIKSVSIGDVGVEFTKSEKERKRLEFYEVYASAWFKNFNKKEPKSGFVRIWDFSPRVITKTMKEELYQVATYGLK
jgi:hypothetical protein